MRVDSVEISSDLVILKIKGLTQTIKETIRERRRRKKGQSAAG